MKHPIILIAVAVTVSMLGSCSDEPENAARSLQPAVSAQAVEAALAAAESYLQTRDTAKAEAIVLRLIDQAPNDPRGYEMHAQVLMGRAADARAAGQPDRASSLFNEAYERYQQVLALSPNSGGLHQSAGEVAQVAGRDDDALAHYTRARELSPLEIKPHFFAAQIYLARGEYGDAEQALKRVLLIDPDEPHAHASLASVAVQQGRFDDALQHIAEARSIRPGDVSFRVIEASIHRRSGRAGDALDLLVGLSDQQRRQWFVAEELAAAYAALDDHRSAARTWAAVHDAAPASPRAWLAAVRAGEAMLAAGQRERAWLWLEQAQLAAPSEPETLALARSFQTEPHELREIGGQAAD